MGGRWRGSNHIRTRVVRARQQGVSGLEVGPAPGCYGRGRGEVRTGGK